MVRRKCPYCDFNSYSGRRHGATRERYVEALVTRPGQGRVQARRGRRLESIFFGGGTPSLFTPAELGQGPRGNRSAISDWQRRRDHDGSQPRARSSAVTSAATGRPASTACRSERSHSTREKLAGARAHTLRRRHRPPLRGRGSGLRQYQHRCHVRAAGSGCRRGDRRRRAGAALGPTHISWYHLTLEPNTVFHTRPPAGSAGRGSVGRNPGGRRGATRRYWVTSATRYPPTHATGGAAATT